MRCLLFLSLKFLTSLFISDRLERILRQLSKAIAPAINTTNHQRNLVPHVLRDLIKLETRPRCLTEMAYEWCSVICEGRRFEDREGLLLDSLEIGFRHLDSRHSRIEFLYLTHTEHHRGMVDVIFKSKNSEAISDLLHAWTVRSRRLEPARELLGICTGYLVDLRNLMPFSSRLRRVLIRSVGTIGYEGFEEVGVEKFIELLNCLRVDVGDVEDKTNWMTLLLDTVRSPGGARDLSNQSWELLAELAILESWQPGRLAYSAHVMASLLEAQEWDKSECWIGVVWMVCPPETEETVEDLKRAMVSLFRHRPGAAQKLTQWMKRKRGVKGVVSKHFERILEQAREAAQQDVS